MSLYNHTFNRSDLCKKLFEWQGSRDSNPNKQNQNLRCYHYTTRQTRLFLSRTGGVDGARTRNPRIDSPVR